MANVVAGTVSPPPDKTRVPTWIRRILLRGLASRPADRFPSMTDMLEALARDPAVRRRRLLSAAAGIAAVAAVSAGFYKTTTGQRAMCAGGPARFAAVWGPAQRSRVERAFQATGHKGAAAAFASVGKVIDEYATRWQGMYGEACEASRVRGEQSGEVLDLRMGCLGERLSSVKALTDVFATADTGVIDNAVGAASALPTLDRCADVAMLRAVVRPPDDPAKRAEVATLREEVARISALASAGRCDQAASDGRKALERASALDYLPLKAEMLLALGRLGDVCIEPREAIGYLEQAELAAETSQHDEIAIVASVLIAGLGADHHAQDTHTSWTWVKHGEAILRRFPGTRCSRPGPPCRGAPVAPRRASGGSAGRAATRAGGQAVAARSGPPRRRASPTSTSRSGCRNWVAAPKRRPSFARCWRRSPGWSVPRTRASRRRC